MVNIDNLNDYRITLDDFSIGTIKHSIKESNISNFLEYEFRNLDCTRILDNGTRLMQTIGLVYRSIISEIIYVCDNYLEEKDRDCYLNILLDIHQKNLEFEKDSPPIWYGGEKSKKKYERNNSSKPKIKKEPKEKKVSAAERKLAAKAIKLNKLNFKINGL